MAYQVPKLETAFALSTDARKRPREKQEDHLRFIRNLFCLVTGQSGVEACHLRFGSLIHGKRGTGLQERPHDRWTVPLCPAEHRIQHSMNEEAYWQSRNIDPLTVAALLWSCSGDTEAAFQIQQGARLGLFPWRKT